jgi:hypothetical protein
MNGSHQFPATRPLNVDLRPFSLVPRDDQKRRQTGVERLDTESKVPQWMFEDTTRIVFGFKTSIVTALWTWNVVALISHLCLMVGTIIASTTSGAKSLNKPSLPMYVSHPHPSSSVRTSIKH